MTNDAIIIALTPLDADMLAFCRSTAADIIFNDAHTDPDDIQTFISDALESYISDIDDDDETRYLILESALTLMILSILP
jgi:hypothetical protein